VKRPGDTLNYHVGFVVALDAPYQNTDQIGLAVRVIFIHITWFLCTGLRHWGATVMDSLEDLLRVAGGTP
jgi:hypothetical protein